MIWIFSKVLEKEIRNKYAQNNRVQKVNEIFTAI